MTTKRARDLVPGDRFWYGKGMEEVIHPTQEWLYGMVTIHVQDALMVRLSAETEVKLVVSVE